MPVLWCAQRVIDRDVARNPVSRLTPVYRFLAYLAVLVMALVMLGDLVYVVFSLLQGDATPRFLLKALVVLAVAGVVSLWYAGDLRREESLAGRPLPPPPARSPSPCPRGRAPMIKQRLRRPSRSKRWRASIPRR